MRSFFTKLLLVAVSIALFQGCATRSLKSRVDFDPATSENGLVVGSITFPTVQPLFNSYRPYLQGVSDKGDSKEFVILPEMTRMIKHNGELNNGKTYLFAIETAPGKYDLNRIKVTSKGFMDRAWGDAVKDFSIPVEVKKGEITYIGEINFNEYGDDIKALLTLSDNFNRDIKGLTAKQPSVDWTKTKKGAMKLIPSK